MTRVGWHLLLWLVLGMTAAHAGEVERAKVTYRHGTYTMELTMVINAEVAPVYALVTDYDHLARISPALVDARRLTPVEAPEQRRKLVTRTCILLFCFQVTMVERVEEQPGGVILTSIIPEASDFRSGRTRWEVTGAGEHHTRIALYTTLEPDFWVPPMVGPWIMKRKMLREARITVDTIEQLMQHE